MLISRVYLGVIGVMFSAFGIWMLMDPLNGTQTFGMVASGPNAAFEMRGVFGGVSLGMALLALTGAIRTNYTRHALFGMLAYFGGYSIARTYSFASGEIPAGNGLYFALFEIAMAIVAVVCLSLTNPKQSEDQ